MYPIGTVEIMNKIAEFVKTGLVPRFPTAILATGFAIISAMMFITAVILDTIVKDGKRKYELHIGKNSC